MLFPPNSLGKRDIWPLTIVQRPLLVRSLSLKGELGGCGYAYPSARLLVITLPPSPPTIFFLPVTLLSVIIDPAPATLRVIPHITNRPTGTLIPVNNRSTALDGRAAPVESSVPALFHRTSLLNSPTCLPRPDPRARGQSVVWVYKGGPGDRFLCALKQGTSTSRARDTASYKCESYKYELQVTKGR